MSAQTVLTIIGGALILIGFILLGLAIRNTRRSNRIEKDAGRDWTLGHMDSQIALLDRALVLARTGGIFCILGSITCFIAFAVGVS